jgi:hypothetical protein
MTRTQQAALVVGLAVLIAAGVTWPYWGQAFLAWLERVVG